MKLITTLILMLLISCSVKEQPPATEGTPPEKNLLASGDIGVSIERFFLVYPGRPKLVANKQNTLTFRIVNQKLSSFEPTKYSFEFTYDMPSMPGMYVPKTQVSQLHTGEFEVLYDISESGAWRLRIDIYENGKFKDRFETMVAASST